MHRTLLIGEPSPNSASRQVDDGRSRRAASACPPPEGSDLQCLAMCAGCIADPGTCTISARTSELSRAPSDQCFHKGMTYKMTLKRILAWTPRPLVENHRTGPGSSPLISSKRSQRSSCMQFPFIMTAHHGRVERRTLPLQSGRDPVGISHDGQGMRLGRQGGECRAVHHVDAR